MRVRFFNFPNVPVLPLNSLVFSLIWNVSQFAKSLNSIILTKSIYNREKKNYYTWCYRVLPVTTQGIFSVNFLQSHSYSLIFHCYYANTCSKWRDCMYFQYYYYVFPILDVVNRLNKDPKIPIKYLEMHWTIVKYTKINKTI